MLLETSNLDGSLGVEVTLRITVSQMTDCLTYPIYDHDIIHSMQLLTTFLNNFLASLHAQKCGLWTPKYTKKIVAFKK